MKSNKLSLVSFTIMALTFMMVSTTHAATASDYKYENSILVEQACIPPVLLDGVYLGASLGYDHFSASQKVDFITPGGNVDARLTMGSLIETGFLGYGLYFDWFYVAGEIWLSNSGAHQSSTINAYHSELAQHATYGAAMLPGIKILPTTLLYTRFGASRTSFKIQENGFPPGMSNSSFEWGNGIVLGLGVETLLYKHLSVRGEYTYTNLDSFNSALGTVYVSSNNQFTVGVVYHIG